MVVTSILLFFMFNLLFVISLLFNFDELCLNLFVLQFNLLKLFFDMLLEIYLNYYLEGCFYVCCTFRVL